jgi:hypothetical protein
MKKMIKPSKKTLKKLNLHLEKFKSIMNDYKEIYPKSIDKNLNHSKILIRNKNLVKTLLIESLFLKLEIRNLRNKKTSLLTKILLKNKQKFINKDFYKDSYLVNSSTRYNRIKIENLKKNLYLIINEILQTNQKIYKTIKINFDYFIKKNPQLISLKKILLLNQKIEIYFHFLKTKVFGKWYIYFARFILISFLYFIPFIQLTSILFYNLPNKQITHPVTSSFLNFIPFLLSTINTTMHTLNKETTSFLILFPYFYFFIWSYKRWKISRKVAYQGTFALALMLYRYSLLLTQEAITLIYKFTKRFFFLRKSQGMDLLRDDISSYVEDLEEMRLYKEEILQLGESIFSLDDITKITMIWESTSIDRKSVV